MVLVLSEDGGEINFKKTPYARKKWLEYKIARLKDRTHMPQIAKYLRMRSKVPMGDNHSEDIKELKSKGKSQVNYTYNKAYGYYDRNDNLVHARNIYSRNYGGRVLKAVNLRAPKARSYVNKFNWCEGAHVPHNFKETAIQGRKYENWKRRNKLK